MNVHDNDLGTQIGQGVFIGCFALFAVVVLAFALAGVLA